MRWKRCDRRAAACIAVVGVILLAAPGGVAAEGPMPAWRFPENATIGALARGVCKGCENDRDVKYCRDFSLTRSQVRILLSKARPITEQQFGQDPNYLWAPCVVRGEARWDETKVRFEISAVLIATVWFDDASTQRLACDGACEEAVYPGTRVHPRVR